MNITYRTPLSDVHVGADVSRSGQAEVRTHGSGSQVWRVRVRVWEGRERVRMWEGRERVWEGSEGVGE